MNPALRPVLAVLLTGLWVNASEFLRNEIFLKHYWVGHYQSLGLVFPSEPVNGAVWVSWGFLFALVIHLLARRFSLVQTALVAWLAGFVLMWVVLWNLKVLPEGLLLFALPLSLLECFVGAWIAHRLAPAQRP